MLNFNKLINNKEIMKKYQEAFPVITKEIEEIYKKCGIEKYKILTPYYFKDFSWREFFNEKKYKDITNYSPNNELLVSMSVNESCFQGNLYYRDQKEVVPVSYIGFPENAQGLNGDFLYKLQKLAKTIEAKICLNYDFKIKQQVNFLSAHFDDDKERKLKEKLEEKFIKFYLAMYLRNKENEYAFFIEKHLKKKKEVSKFLSYLVVYDFFNNQIVK
ncbi:MAG: hypothetical protein ACTSXL_02805 [Alphaproteobacteria bacterium]